MTKYHIPVLAEEVLKTLEINSQDTVIDCTLGGGGHSELMLKQNPKQLFGIDQDMDAIKHASAKLKKFSNFTTIHDSFFDIKKIAAENNITKANKILADLGISSYQIDTPERGFSFQADGPLDMRMNQSQEFDAGTVVNTYSIKELTKIIKEYGEEPKALFIAQEISKSRESAPITTTTKLKDLIGTAVRGSYDVKQKAIRRTFQAIRIEVNHELEKLEAAIIDLIDILAPGGRLAIITFHSLEDKIVKNIFKDKAIDCICPPVFPVCRCSHRAEIIKITKKAITAKLEEIERNPRVKSAKLRVIQKLDKTKHE
jgi:16S rRNA (cytosine1402-N4)-methyltransferase